MWTPSDVRRRDTPKTNRPPHRTLKSSWFEVEDLVAEDDRVALRVSVHRDGGATDEPATSILEIFRIDDDRVAEIWGAGTG